MYQLQVSVQEWPSVWRVHFSFSLTESNGRSRAFGTKEVWIQPPESPDDPLTEALRALRKACDSELRPNR